MEMMYGDGPTNEAWFAAHAYFCCMNLERETFDRDWRGSIHSNPKRKFSYDEYLESCAFCANMGVTMGFLRRDAWWKFNHEQAAMSYYEQAERLKKQSTKGANSTARRWSELREACLGFFPKAYFEKGAAFLGAPPNVVAETIREIALRERPNDFVGPKNEPLKLRWFIETIENFQADGRLGAAIENAMRDSLRPSGE